MKDALEPDAPIGAIAREHPEFIQVFDRFSVDYCCHGGETVMEACARAGVDFKALAHALTDATAHRPAHEEQVDAAALSMSGLCDHIERRYHAPAREMLARLATLSERVGNVHGSVEPAAMRLTEIIRALRDEMLDHMVREERVLFPWIRRLATAGSIHIGPPWSVSRPIGCMMHDHARIAELFLEARGLEPRLASIRRGCESMSSLLQLLHEFERETRHHIHAENNVLFPAAERAEAEREGVVR